MSVLQIVLNCEVHTLVQLTFIQVAISLAKNIFFLRELCIKFVPKSERILRQLDCLLNTERPQSQDMTGRLIPKEGVVT